MVIKTDILTVPETGNTIYLEAAWNNFTQEVDRDVAERQARLTAEHIISNGLVVATINGVPAIITDGANPDAVINMNRSKGRPDRQPGSLVWPDEYELSSVSRGGHQVALDIQRIRMKLIRHYYPGSNLEQLNETDLLHFFPENAIMRLLEESWGKTFLRLPIIAPPEGQQKNPAYHQTEDGSWTAQVFKFPGVVQKYYIDRVSEHLKYIAGYDFLPPIAITSGNIHRQEPPTRGKAEMCRLANQLNASLVINLGILKDDRPGSWVIADYSNGQDILAREGNLPFLIAPRNLKLSAAEDYMNGKYGREAQDYLEREFKAREFSRFSIPPDKAAAIYYHVIEQINIFNEMVRNEDPRITDIINRNGNSDLLGDIRRLIYNGTPCEIAINTVLCE